MAPHRAMRPDDVPRWFAWVVGAFGAALIALPFLLTSAKGDGPAWVGVLIGLIVVNASVLLGLAPTRHARPARYAFAAALIISGFSALGWWVALFSTGPITMSVGSGSASVSGQVSGLMPRVAFGFGALICTLFAGIAWRSFARVLRGAQPQFK